MKIVFMGTPQFAAHILSELVDAGHEIVSVYTQPDKAKGRSGALIASEVKEYALSKGFTVVQPERIKKLENVDVLRSFDAEVFVVAAYGQILSEEILNMPKYGCVNVHGSLLPKYRGAAPIQRAIADGESITGVTVQQMDKGVDTGDILKMVEIPIEDIDNEDSMYEKMAVKGAKALLEVLSEIEAGTIVRTPQNDEEATYAPMLTKEEGLIDFNKSAKSIDCKVRGFQNWPTAYTGCGGKMLKVYVTKAVDAVAGVEVGQYEPGQLIVLKKNIYVATGEGFLELVEVQLEGKKRMNACDFARGTHLQSGDRLSV